MVAVQAWLTLDMNDNILENLMDTSSCWSQLDMFVPKFLLEFQ